MNDRSTRQKARNMQSNNELESLFGIRAMYNFRGRLYRHKRGLLRAGKGNLEALILEARNTRAANAASQDFQISASSATPMCTSKY
jgi:hypothetical protein